MEVLVRYSDFTEKIKSVEIPFNGGSQTIEVSDKVIYDIDGVTVKDVLEVVKFKFADNLNFDVTQEMTKQEIEDYLEILRKFIMQMETV